MTDNRVAYVLMVIAIIVMGAVVYFWPVKVKAHDAETGWTYPPECCGNNDCEMIHGASRIRTVDDGFLIDGHYYIAQRDTRLSPDGRWHVCIFNGKLYCVFRPFDGS